MDPQIEGMSVGLTLHDPIMIEIVNQTVAWTFRQRWLDRARWLRHRLRSMRRSEGLRVLPTGRLLVTWLSNTQRLNDLILPVIEELGPQRCGILYRNKSVVPLLPPGAAGISWDAAMPHDPRTWAKSFRRCWPAWRSALKKVCREYYLPSGVFDRMAVHVLTQSRGLLGNLELLRRCRPTAIVSDFDRSESSSCLVLAARTLGIPTFGLLHGMLPALPRGFPLTLADRFFNWGEFDRNMAIEAGEDPAKLILGGCPRFSRELSVSPAAARVRLGLPPDRPVVMLGTSTYNAALRSGMTEIFCAGLERLAGVTGIVRLHASEKLAAYAAAAKRHPTIHFHDNRRATLDEALAAADVVVVQCQRPGERCPGETAADGGDRRPAVALGQEGLDLVREAGCPLVTSAEKWPRRCGACSSMKRSAVAMPPRRNGSSRSSAHTLARIRPAEFPNRFCKQLGPRAEAGDEAMAAGEDCRPLRVPSKPGAGPHNPFLATARLVEPGTS